MEIMDLTRDRKIKDTYMCSKLCDMVARGDLRENHPQQRKSGQWTNETRDNFIVSVILNEDFDPIKICEQLTDNGVILWLIDGLQRSTTIENFRSGKFVLGNKITPSIIRYQESIRENGNFTYKIAEYDLRGKSYKDLPDKLRENFDNCNVDIIKHLDCSDEDIGRHIVRYNSGRPMVASQKIAAYMHNSIKYIKDLSSHAFFSDCAAFSNTADRNGTVDKVVSEAIMGINYFHDWNKDAKKIGTYINDNAEEEVFANFKEYLNRLYNVVTPETGKYFTQKNSILFFMLFDRFTKYEMDDIYFQKFLENLEVLKKTKVTALNQYETEKGSGEYTNVVSFAFLDAAITSKNKGAIEDKLFILEKLMKDFFNVDDESPNSLKYNDSNKLDDEEKNLLSYIKDNVSRDITYDDVELYHDILNDCIKVDSLLKEKVELKNLISIVAYACKIERDDILSEWFQDIEKNEFSYWNNEISVYQNLMINFEKYIEDREL